MWARASNLYRHLECPAASWLPRDEDGQWRRGYLQNEEDFVVPFEDNADSSMFAEWGTKMHSAKENSDIAEEPFLSRVNPHRERLWPAKLGQHEIPIKYNCRSKTVIECPESIIKNGGKDAWKRLSGPDDITGTADWVGSIPTGDLWIDDLKTGHATPDPKSVQLLFYALAFFKLDVQKGLRDKADTRIIRTSATHWQRNKDEPTRYWAQVTWKDLEEFEEQIELAWRHATGKEPKAVPGIWCNYCSSLVVCDAINGIEYSHIGEDEL